MGTLHSIKPSYNAEAVFSITHFWRKSGQPTNPETVFLYNILSIENLARCNHEAFSETIFYA
jgi:hypothetical protein